MKELELYSLERRRERCLIILAWQMIEGIKEKKLNLKTSRNRSRRIWMLIIRWSKSGVNIKHSVRTRVHNNTASKMDRLFNNLPLSLRVITGVTVETFKRNLDVWLKGMPDTPKIDNYSCSAETNSIVHQTVTQ